MLYLFYNECFFSEAEKGAEKKQVKAGEPLFILSVFSNVLDVILDIVN